MALYRDAATGDRFVAFGSRTGVQVPEGSRLIAHTQPGTGAAAVRASVADEAALARLGQRSSVIIDEGGTAATRFHATERGAELAQSQRAGSAIELNAPKVGDPAKMLRDAGQSPPAGMIRPHGHHIVFEQGLGSAQKALVTEGQAILRKHGIDPVGGLENSVWTPNVKGQHTLESIKTVVDELRRLDDLGTSKTEIVETLVKFGIEA